MSASDTVLTVLMGLVTLMGSFALPTLWGGVYPPGTEPQSWWPWGERTWAAWVRSMPVSIVSFAGDLVILVVGATVHEHQWAGFARPWWYVLPALTFIGIQILLVLSIALFNRPKKLVPPYRRSDRGLLQRDRGRVRSRARTTDGTDS